MEQLSMKYERLEKNKKELIFSSNDVDSIIKWTITALYDGAIKRARIKADQYYTDGVEYCKIVATYKRLDPDYNEVKDIYTITGWRNDWGDFINVYDTFKDNNIEIKEGR